VSDDARRQGETFRKGYGWTPALSDPDPRVRHAARQALYGKTAGKTKRYGRRRQRSPRMPGSLDGDVERFLAGLASDTDARRAWRKQIAKAHGITFEDVRRATTRRRGKPPREEATHRLRVAVALAEIVDSEIGHTQRGRRVTRRVLMLLYGIENERQFERLLADGRVAHVNDGSIAKDRERHAARVNDGSNTEGGEEFEDDKDAGLDEGLAGDAPAYDRDTGRFE
jgi:hypothetical protein